MSAGRHGWHMRAAAWATNRDIAAARLSWGTRGKIATPYPPTTPTERRCASRPAPCCAGPLGEPIRTLPVTPLRNCDSLCTAAGDKASLVIGMAGQAMDYAYQTRLREASQFASEAWALIESIGDPTLTVGLSMLVVLAKCEAGEWADVLRWSQKIIDLADGDPSKGNFIVPSPLATAFSTRVWPGISWVFPDGARTSGTPLGTPAAPTIGPTPRLSNSSTSRVYRMACSCRTIMRCARSWMQCTRASDPGMISCWRMPG